MRELAIETLMNNWKELVDSGEFSESEMIESLTEQVEGDCQGWDCSEEDLTDELAEMMGWDIEDMTDEQFDEWADIVAEAAKRYIA